MRKDAALIAAEKKEKAEKETAQFGKVLGSMPGSEEERRQQALEMLRKKAQAKRDGKRVATDESVADIAHKQAPPKRAKAPRKPSGEGIVLEKGNKGNDDPPTIQTKAKAPRSKKVATPPLEQQEDSPLENDEDEQAEEESGNKGFNDGRDRERDPSEEELLTQLRLGVAWPPTRFADVGLMKELYIDEDMKELLEYMNMGSFYSMAFPTHKEVSCQFLATLEATFHSTQHKTQGWGSISFKIDERKYLMSFAEIGEVLGLKDAKEPFLRKPKGLPKVEGKEKTLAYFIFKLLSGKPRRASRDKNASLRHPAVRYLHRLIAHTIHPRTEISNVNAEELCLMHQAIRHYAPPPQLPDIPSDFYNEFGMVGYFVKRLLHYKDYAWTNRDPKAQIGIGGLITPLLQYLEINLGNDETGPAFLDLGYMRSAHYFSGRYERKCVYSYLRGTKKAELCLPNFVLTTLREPGAISFDISEEHLLKSHGPLSPMALPILKNASKSSVYDEGYSTRATAHLYGPPRYHFDQCTTSLPLGPLRQAHDQIGTLQRWSRAQDRTIYKLTNKCKELRKTVKRQAEASAQFMRKVVDVLTKGAVAGCKQEDFDLDAFLAPPPLPLYDPSAPSTRRQLRRRMRNPPILPSESGNKSPSLNTTDEEDDSEGEASASSHAH